MSNFVSFEGWIVAHSRMGVEVKTPADRGGQCEGGGRRVTFEAINIDEAKNHTEHCQFCWTDQPVAAVNGPINRNII